MYVILKRRTPLMLLNDQRLNLVISLLSKNNASRVLDLGCGEGNLIRLLMKHKRFTEIVGIDISPIRLNQVREWLDFSKFPPSRKKDLKLIQASLLNPDKRLCGYDGAAIIEVIEHMELQDLPLFEKAIFDYAQPRVIILTTPNIEYNIKKGLRKGKLRHPDHRFEWTRSQFSLWAKRVGYDFGYTVSFLPIGDLDEKVGPPTQVAFFEKIRE
jgi:3' terminal RNA ribose 2'-O-methyltransferase Hen1